MHSAVDILKLAVVYLYFLRLTILAMDKIQRLKRTWSTKPYISEVARDFYGALNTTFSYFFRNDTEEFCRFMRIAYSSWLDHPSKNLVDESHCQQRFV